MRWPWRRRRPERPVVDVRQQGTSVFTTGVWTPGHEISFTSAPWTSGSTVTTAELMRQGFERVAELMRDKPEIEWRPRSSPWGAYGGGNPWGTYTRRGDR